MSDLVLIILLLIQLIICCCLVQLQYLLCNFVLFV